MRKTRTKDTTLLRTLTALLRRRAPASQLGCAVSCCCIPIRIRICIHNIRRQVGGAQCRRGWLSTRKDDITIERERRLAAARAAVASFPAGGFGAWYGPHRVRAAESLRSPLAEKLQLKNLAPQRHDLSVFHLEQLAEGKGEGKEKRVSYRMPPV